MGNLSLARVWAHFLDHLNRYFCARQSIWWGLLLHICCVHVPYTILILFGLAILGALTWQNLVAQGRGVPLAVISSQGIRILLPWQALVHKGRLIYHFGLQVTTRLLLLFWLKPSRRLHLPVQQRWTLLEWLKLALMMIWLALLLLLCEYGI